MSENSARSVVELNDANKTNLKLHHKVQKTLCGLLQRIEKMESVWGEQMHRSDLFHKRLSEIEKYLGMKPPEQLIEQEKRLEAITDLLAELFSGDTK